MKIGVPSEIKNHEYRVGATPRSVQEFVRAGHTVWVQSGAGLGIGADDAAYTAVGANIASDAQQVFDQAQLIIKVKEPQPSETAMLRPEHILFTYLHLAPDLVQTEALLKSGATCIAYETVVDRNGGLPLLAPMSRVAGRMSIQAAAHCLERAHGGSGKLLGGVPGVEPANVLIIGGGVVGRNAAEMAVGLRANVTVVDRSDAAMTACDQQFAGRVKTVASSRSAIEALLPNTDVVIGAVLLPGAAAPKLVTQDMLKLLPVSSVVVDVAVDQGGCFETTRATTHAEPTYVVEDIVHYCVANMPGAVPRTSTEALNNATLDYALRIANLGWEEACRRDPGLLAGLNVQAGRLTNADVAAAHGMDYCDPALVLSQGVAA